MRLWHAETIQASAGDTRVGMTAGVGWVALIRTFHWQLALLDRVVRL